MAIGYGVAVPKGKTRKQITARKQRNDAKGLKAFRDAVWARESARLSREDESREWARCQHCARFVMQADGHRHGEVHHRIGRRAKATRYDPANGVLLCHDCHGKAQRHEITV
jgi:hypothetical protein